MRLVIQAANIRLSPAPDSDGYVAAIDVPDDAAVQFENFTPFTDFANRDEHYANVDMVMVVRVADDEEIDGEEAE